MQPSGPTLVSFFILSFTSVWSRLKFWAGVDFMIALALVRNSVSVVSVALIVRGSLFKVKQGAVMMEEKTWSREWTWEGSATDSRVKLCAKHSAHP